MLGLTEVEIQANWSKEQPIRVSVCCITYKQAQYITQALDSFLMQKTTFPFEIIIGEDCGGDGTLDILADYQIRYPNLIRVVASEQNVGANANLLRVFNTAKGEYIAVCEGDDYWIDIYKLEKQFNYMERSQCSFVVHPAKVLVNGQEKQINWPCQMGQQLDFMLSVKGQFSPTSSYFFKRKIIDSFPKWFEDAPIGDYYIEAFASFFDKCECINESMSVYRLSAVNSWSASLMGQGKGLKIVETYKKNIEYLCKLIPLIPGYERFIKIKISHAEYACALGYWDHGDFELFKKHMDNSYTTMWYDMFHKTLFYTRNFRCLVKIIFSIKHVLKYVLNKVA